jgi:hypothetical protein
MCVAILASIFLASVIVFTVVSVTSKPGAFDSPYLGKENAVSSQVVVDTGDYRGDLIVHHDQASMVTCFIYEGKPAHGRVPTMVCLSDRDVAACAPQSKESKKKRFTKSQIQAIHDRHPEFYDVASTKD